jgi:hypothetical protein
MNVRSSLLAVLTLSLLLPVPSARADCWSDCSQRLQECNSSCSQCDCYGEYNDCVNQCQYVDTDSDGVLDVNDNCPDVANSNQADCDGDGIGTACDSVNGTYVASGSPSVCASDRDNHFWGYTIEVTYQRTYVDSSSCHSSARNAYITYTSSCSFNLGEYSCCQGATVNSTDDWICSPMGQFSCNPQTWWP